MQFVPSLGVLRRVALLALVASCDSSRQDGYVAVSTYQSTNCALHASARAVCWGQGITTPLVFEDVDEVSAGNGAVCVRRGRAIECVDTQVVPQARLVSDVPAGEYTRVVAGGASACAIRVDGSGVCWGGHESGPATREVPTTEALADLTTAGGGPCALTRGGAAFCWPFSENSVMPTDGTLYFRPLPDGTYTDIVACGGEAQCAVDSNQEIVCAYGMCKIDPSTQEEVCFEPTTWLAKIGPMPSGPFERVGASGSSFLCGLRPDGELVCWGETFTGFIAPYAPAARRYRSLGVGRGHVCTVALDGTLECWGDNSRGQTDVPNTEW